MLHLFCCSACHLYVSYFFYEPLAVIHFCPRHLSRVELRGGYHEYTEVRSCQDVVHLYHLLWSATILNTVALFLGIITAAVLGGFKDMVRLKCCATYIYAFCMISEILWHLLGLFLRCLQQHQIPVSQNLSLFLRPQRLLDPQHPTTLFTTLTPAYLHTLPMTFR